MEHYIFSYLPRWLCNNLKEDLLRLVKIVRECCTAGFYPAVMPGLRSFNCSLINDCMLSPMPPMPQDQQATIFQCIWEAFNDNLLLHYEICLESLVAICPCIADTTLGAVFVQHYQSVGRAVDLFLRKYAM